MKTIFLFISISVVAALTAFIVQPNQVCIEVKNRQHLPNGIYEELKSYRAILIGEMHGTNESPQYVEGIVNLWLGNGQKVILGLEINGNEQSKIDSFLSTGYFSIIEKATFFNNTYRDGRNSTAIGNLIKSCYGKPNLKVVCLDIANWKIPNRDSMMAVCENDMLKSNSGWALITLTGNIHNKIDSSQYGKTMGWCLCNNPKSIMTRKDIASVDVVFNSGSAWCCQPNCGVHKESSSPSWITNECKYDNFFRIYRDGTTVLFTKTITASSPLKL
ncbi:MAG TPA: hypothetical protein VK806_07300 [Bacteroidia bacterium]|nr:hypothetical protein [Bacteroidia bacterium]